MEEKGLNEEGDTSNGQLIEVTGEINDNLIKENNNFEKSSSNTSSESCFKKVIYAIFPYFKKVNTTSKKTVYIKDYYLNRTEWSNKIENQKYNLITFIPVVLYNQFKQFGNFFYLIMSVSQFFEELKVGFYLHIFHL